MSESFYDPEKNYLGSGRNQVPAETSFDEWIEFGMNKGWCGPQSAQLMMEFRFLKPKSPHGKKEVTRVCM